jgi:Ser/Thr protein kinase RdoA (MazF antagonist)
MMEASNFLAAKAVAQFLGGQSCESIRRITQGLSGGAVYRCVTRRGDFALKRWPDQTSSERIAEVHRVQKFVSQAMPIVPQLQELLSTELNLDPKFSGGKTCLELQGARFDLATWMPGKSFGERLHASMPESEVLRAVRLGMSAIAQFHRRSEQWGPIDRVAPAVLRRWDRLNELKTELPEALRSESQLRGPAKRATDLLANQWRQFHHFSESQLRPWLTRVVPTIWVLRDVHREHILFEGGQVTGMVDFDAVNQDTRATDLARWVGSFADFGNSTSHLWTAAIEGYTQQHTISPCEQELAGAIEEASWFIHLANWVIWTTKSSREIPGGLEAAERRIECLLRRNDAC